MLININNETLKRGITIGWGMGNLKVLWQDVNVPQEIKIVQLQELDKWRNAILEEFSLLAPYAVNNIDGTSYDTFKKSVYLFFLGNNIDFYYSSLIGEIIFWSKMQRSGNEKQKQQMSDNINEYLKEIPDNILTDQNKLIEYINQHLDDNILNIVYGLEEINAVDSSPMQDLFERIDKAISELQNYIDKYANSASHVISIGMAKEAKQDFINMKESIDEDISHLEEKFQKKYSYISQALGWS